MRITLTGGTGFIGRRLVARLLADGDSLHLLGRRARGGVRFTDWDAGAGAPPADAFEGADAVIHLAGEPVAQRWTEEARRKIRDSRVNGTQSLVQVLSNLKDRPACLVCGSAIGIYGDRGDEVLMESSPPGQGFLADVCREWEETAGRAEALGMRVVRVRIGVVLGKGGGALARMLPPFKSGLGGRLSSGRQWMSWIHLDDLVNLIRFSLTAPLSGPVNATAPNPVSNAEFTRVLARALHRPAILPVPAAALKLMFGDMAEVLLASQRVLPQAAQSAGFRFHYPELPLALKTLLE